MRKKLLGSKNTQVTARREGAVFLQFTRENFEKQLVKKSLPQEARKLPQLASRRHKKLFIHKCSPGRSLSCLLPFYYNIISGIEFIQPMSTLGWQ